MREADLYNPMIVGARRSGWALYRIADGSYGKNPFDIGGVAPGGTGVAIEVKMTREQPSLLLQWNHFEAHQIAWLQAFANLGGLALAIIYSTKDSKLVAYTIPCGLDAQQLLDTNYRDLNPIVLSHADGAWFGWSAVLVNFITNRAEVVELMKGKVPYCPHCDTFHRPTEVCFRL